MLEAKHLCKEYKTKNSPVVKALDDVSVKFEETGMVFILGKSGSGKSTLLNVLGGLDSYDSGEVIVKGKSSKDFSSSDFDSYRNTFIGFIFQDYNILEEYTISKNIGLALELQGKKADKSTINELLKEVGLEGYGKRKPNTLSGGQRQRVAIARALVKNPEIIMADEPTGALDSNTGKQVLDTLKELSKTKLVLVVSHDKEFAEYYGDRIIELADGKIINDISKYKSEPKISDGFEIVDDKILTIKKGTKLDTNKTKTLKEFIEKHDEDIIVSVDSDANDKFKQFARIDESGHKESFKETENLNTKDYDPKKFKLIKSKLPGKDSFKMGASSLKSKPIRLVFTIILSAIAFALFGLADTMGSYDKVENTIKSIEDTRIDYASFSKKVKQDGDYYNNTKLSISDYYNIKNDLPTFDFIPVYNINDGYSNYVSYSSNVYSKEDVKFTNGYYITNLYGGVELTENNRHQIGDLIEGRIPQKDNEIVITKYMFDIFKEGGYRSISSTTKQDINNTSDIINKTLSIGGESYKIVGIIDTHIDLSRYESMTKENFGRGSSNMSDFMLSNELSNYISYSYHSLAYLNEGYFNRHNDTGIFSQLDSNDFINFTVKNTKPTEEDMMYGVQYIAGYTNASNVEWKGNIKSTLEDNEVIVSFNMLNSLNYTIDGVLVKGDELVSGDYRAVIFNHKTLAKLQELGIESPDDKDFDVNQLLYYFGNNFDTSTYTYNDIGEKNWISNDMVPCYMSNGTHECSQFINYDGGSFEIAYNNESNIATYDNIDYPVVDGKVEINGIEFVFELQNEVGYDKEYSITYNRAALMFYVYYKKGLTVDQKEQIENYLKTYTYSYDFNPTKEIKTYYKTDELYDYRTSETGLNENWINKEYYINFLLNGVMGEAYHTSSFESYTNDEKNLINHIRSMVAMGLTNYIDSKMWITTSKDMSNGRMEYKEYEIVGIYTGETPTSDMYMTYGIISNSIYNTFSDSVGGIYNFVIAPLNINNSEEVKKIVNYTYTDQGKIQYYLNNTVMNSITQVNELIETLSKVFLYIGIGFAVFAALLLLNFITISISYKKREIGVLRAIGARGFDVFKIFFNEAFIIAFINFVLALIGCVSVCTILNGIMRNNYGVLITILNVGLRQVILMFAISVLVAFISSFIPVNSIAKKKPIDAIRNA